MRTEDEIHQATEAVAWYITHRFVLQDRDTQNNLVGCLFALEWVLKINTAMDANPIVATLRDIATLRQKMEGN